MIFVLLFIVLIAGLYFLRIKTKNKMISQQTVIITGCLSKFIMISPFIAGAIFTILFTTVLRGRLVERSTHALIVFTLWIYSVSFYNEILKYFKSRSILVGALIGFGLSVSLAIILTPLDRYCKLLFSSIQEVAFLLGGIMLLIIYGIQIKMK